MHMVGLWDVFYLCVRPKCSTKNYSLVCCLLSYDGDVCSTGFHQDSPTSTFRMERFHRKCCCFPPSGRRGMTPITVKTDSLKRTHLSRSFQPRFAKLMIRALFKINTYLTRELGRKNDSLESPIRSSHKSKVCAPGYRPES